jgi:hypothetical protein
MPTIYLTSIELFTHDDALGGRREETDEHKNSIGHISCVEIPYLIMLAGHLKVY